MEKKRSPRISSPVKGTTKEKKKGIDSRGNERQRT
jgi:hypothetical protein